MLVSRQAASEEAVPEWDVQVGFVAAALGVRHLPTGASAFVCPRCGRRHVRCPPPRLLRAPALSDPSGVALEVEISLQ